MNMLAAAGWAARQFTRASFELSPLGAGLINETYRVSVESGEPFVLQRLNPRVFPHPPAILANYRHLLDHLSNRPEPSHLRIPGLISTRSGADFLCDEAGYFWRAQEYLSNTRTLTHITSPQQAQAVGAALGYFHALFADLPPDGLEDTLPGFHITSGYLEHYDQVLASTTTIRADSALKQAMAEVEAGRLRASTLEEASQRGELPMRVTHGDPKLDNMLFDRCEDRVISLIDLDTVKAGLPHYDLGDCLRSCCGRKNPAEPAFDLSVGVPLLRAYHAASQDYTSSLERQYWYTAIWLIPYELGLRFLTDHLNGDAYFKVEQPGQNLRRALEQFRIALEVERQHTALSQVLSELE
ncbi:MAG: phosphotransferase enzyme family protein [Methylococcaceae bacterium]